MRKKMVASVLSKIAVHTAKKETKRPAQKDTGNRKPMAYICAPFYPHTSDPDKAEQEFAQNIREMREADLTAWTFGFIPVAPALYFGQLFDDSDKRQYEKRIELSLDCIPYCDEFIVVSSRTDAEMTREIAEAKSNGMRIIRWKNANEPMEDMYRLICGNDADRMGHDGLR